MGRYRPPQPKGSCYITPEGKKNLEQELNYLWRVKRPEVTQSVSEAAAQGDRSENAEYIYGKKQLREIDRRIRFLQKRIDELITVDRAPDDKDRVFFGAWVRVENDSGDIEEYRIVGPDEFDMEKRWISMDSPMGRAVLKKAVDDHFTVSLPKGEAEFTVVAVSYSGFSAQQDSS